MKMKGAKAVHYDAGPNMTPLVDVVMVILIFFMLAGNFGDKDQYLASSVPIKQKGVPIPNQTVPDDVELKITVDPTDNGNSYSARLEGVESTFTDANQLTTVLSQKLAAYLAVGKKPDDIQVLISPAGAVRYSYTIQVYAAALAATAEQGGKKLGFTKVAFEASHN